MIYQQIEYRPGWLAKSEEEVGESEARHKAFWKALTESVRHEERGTPCESITSI